MQAGDEAQHALVMDVSEALAESNGKCLAGARGMRHRCITHCVTRAQPDELESFAQVTSLSLSCSDPPF